MGERRALPEHRRQPPHALISDAVATEDEVGERRALREQRRQPPQALSSYAVSSLPQGR